MFAAHCRGEAFATIGIHAFIPKLANASPLLFQKTKVLPSVVRLGNCVKLVSEKNKAKILF